MLESGGESFFHRSPSWISRIISCLVSLVSVVVIQLTLFSLRLYLPTSSFFTLLPLSALLIVIVVGSGRWFKMIAGVRASAPAFVFFSIFFIWAVYICMVREVISPLSDIAFNVEIIIVIIALYRIMSTDPGFVRDRSSFRDPVVKSHFVEAESNSEALKAAAFVTRQEYLTEEIFTVQRRIRYCRHCKEYVLGFDHHCPAFGNCIGQKNHFFFIVLLFGFAVAEVSYSALASEYIAKSQTFNDVRREQTVISRDLVFSTMMFSIVQVVWQVVFIAWHVYCACFNIKTDEWINWKKYPEFLVEVPRSGQSETEIQFKNPYDKGVVTNLKNFITAEG